MELRAYFAYVILSEAKEAKPSSGSFASLRMTK